MTKKSWNTDDEDKLTKLYKDGNKNIISLATIFDKPKKSIISKLVQLKIYEKPEKITAAAKQVKYLIRELEIMLDMNVLGMNLNKKENLTVLVERVKELYEQSEANNSN